MWHARRAAAPPARVLHLGRATVAMSGLNRTRPLPKDADKGHDSPPASVQTKSILCADYSYYSLQVAA